MTTKLTNLCEKKGITITSKWVDKNPNMSDMPRGSSHYHVTLRRRVDGRARSLTTFFSMGPAHSSEPSAADVLSCLVSDTSSGEMSFGEFCSEFGANPDSRKAEQTHKACARTAPNVRRFLAEDFDAFAQAEH